MRKWNAVISILIIALFLVHAVAGAFVLLGFIPGGGIALKVMAWALIAVLAVHVVLGAALTVISLLTVRKTGRRYLRENTLFWVRRASGFAILFFLFSHLMIFVVFADQVYRLHLFEGAQLVGQLLLAASVLVHILSNIRPLMISFGLGKLRIYIKDILLIFSVILCFGGAAFVIYFLRWNVLWK